MAFKRWQKTPSKKPPEKTWLENEMKIGTFNLSGSSFSVDTKDDFLKAIKFMNVDKIRTKY